MFFFLLSLYWLSLKKIERQETMRRCIILLLVVVIYRTVDVVLAKPGFDDSPALSLYSLRYSHELHRQYHIDNGMAFVKKQMSKASALNTNIAKNAILFLGDGMSVPTLAAARMYTGGEEKSLSFETFPYVAMSKTYCVDKQVADSACTATGKLSIFCSQKYFN